MKREALVMAALTAYTYSEPLFAQTNNLADSRCAAIGKAFAPHAGRLDSSLHVCFQWAQEKVRSRPSLFASLPNNSVKVFGFNNIIYVQRGEDYSIISGNMSKIEDIQAVALSQDGKLISVLDQYKTESGKIKKRLLFFKSQQNGNVVPFSLNENELITEAKSISFSSNSEEIFVFLKKNVVSFNISDDSRSPLESKKPQKKKNLVLSRELTSSSGSLVSKEQQLVLLNPEFGVQAYDLSSETPKMLWEIKAGHNLIKNLTDLSHLVYDHEKKILSIFDSQGQSARISY